jgi:hypothetical protein
MSTLESINNKGEYTMSSKLGKIGKFEVLTGDVNYLDYGAKWYRQTSESCYHVITLVNMWDATGDDDQDKYDIQLEEIDLAEISQKNIDSALSCCGWNDDQEITALMTIDSISNYGCFAYMGHWSGNNFKKLWNIAYNESFSLSDEDYHEKRMNRTVNQLGSTAREVMQGDFTSAVIRGIAKGDISARIMGKIHGLKDDDLNSIAGDENLKNFGL